MDSPYTLPVVVGTAGHIDHGKSALVEALCDEHPDRWEEEKARGITIDLGYAEAQWEDGLEIGFVDVPGHERLVRKMVAGATGMGAAILIVACDDGVMPQTEEHFEVLQLLGIDFGLVALTKADLADDDTRSLVREDVENLLKGSTWEEVKIFPVSAHTGEGMPKLKEEIRVLAEQAKTKISPLQAFRLPVQRVFALHGAGTVVTGVCSSGTLQEGEQVEVHPLESASRVRRVQVHGRQTAEAFPGLRTALNLPQIEVEDCYRGVVVATPGSLRSGRILHLSWSSLPSAPAIKQGGEVQVLSGAFSVKGKIYFPPSGQGRLGHELVVDVSLEEEVALTPGDKVLLRRPSPATNLGAGIFLAFGKQRLRSRDAERREKLLERAQCLKDSTALLLSFMNANEAPKGSSDICLEFGWISEEVDRMLEEQSLAGQIREVQPGLYIGLGSASQLGQQIAELVARWHVKNPHRLCMPISRIRTGLGKEKFSTLRAMSDEELCSFGLAPRPGLLWKMVGIDVDVKWHDWGLLCLKDLAQKKLKPEAWSDLALSNGVPSESIEYLAEYLEDAQKVLRRGPYLFDISWVEELRQKVVSQLNGDGMDIPLLRDSFETSRKYLMPLLEYLDDCGVTIRRGGNRVLGDPEALLL